MAEIATVIARAIAARFGKQLLAIEATRARRGKKNGNARRRTGGLPTGERASARRRNTQVRQGGYVR